MIFKCNVMDTAARSEICEHVCTKMKSFVRKKATQPRWDTVMNKGRHTQTILKTVGMSRIMQLAFSARTGPPTKAMLC